MTATRTLAARGSAFDPHVVAADYTVAALGVDGAALLMRATQADWLTPAEAAQLRPFTAGLAQLLGVPTPDHRAA